MDPPKIGERAQRRLDWLRRRATPKDASRPQVVWSGATAVRVTACKVHGEAVDKGCPGCAEALRRVWFAQQCARKREEKLRRRAGPPKD